ncbi:MAG TPA: Hsp33 family molecular chaperone HslO [Anaeromyxobacteraceae bacterium]|nr:Hsp33 family molecular chaperone HslO [Anaeromyxobacteraceae bacterium]
MKDQLLRGLVQPGDLRVLLVEATDLARMARTLHGLAPTSAAILAEALTAGLLLGALQKERTRVNLALEVDGPISGLLVDADTDGNVRGRVRRPDVHFPGDPSVGPRAALGGSGTLSVLRDLGRGEFYRGSVEFLPGTLTDNLRRYFTASEQVATALDVRVLADGSEPLGTVAGIVVQKMPEGSLEALEAVRARIDAGAFAEALRRGESDETLVRSVAGEGLSVLSRAPLGYVCNCSRERAVNAVSALGPDGIRTVLAEDGQVVIDCEFCRKRWVIGPEELSEMARRLEGGVPGGARA